MEIKGLLCRCCFLFLSVPALGQEAPQVSTAAAKPRENENPLMLTIEKDRRESRIWLDYSVRWDFSDLAGFRPGLRTIADGIAAIGSWDITENTRIRYYGFRMNPWRLFIGKEKVAEPASAAGNSKYTSAGRNSTVYKKKVRLSLSPLVDDIKREADENLRMVLLKNSLSPIAPQWKNVSTRNKKLFFQDVLSLQIWELPGLDATKQGLEYISK